MNRLRFLLLFLNFFIFGGIVTIVGATLPQIIDAFSWSYAATGVVIAAGPVGYFASTFFSGILLHRVGPRKLLLSGLLLQTVGVACFGVDARVLLNFICLMLMGMGQGATEVVTNYYVVQEEPAGESRLMNLMHSAFTVGAVAAPISTGILLEMGAEWRTIYLLMALLSLMMLVAMMRQSFQSAEPRALESGAGAGLTKLLRRPRLALLTLIIFLYVGAEIGISSWISEYHVKTLGSSASVGAWMVSIFWLGILLGRVVSSLVYKGNRPANLLLGFACFAVVSLAGALPAKSIAISSVLFFLTGVGYSTIYPVVMTLVGRLFAAEQGAAIGVVSTGGGVGAFLSPLAMSSIADRYGIRHGFNFYLLVTIGMAAATLGFLRIAGRKVNFRY